MPEKLCLKWNDFQENVNTVFGSLRGDNEFADVTLACEDGQQIEADKVILAASSPLFQSLLKRNRHPHPLIFMRGVKSEDLLAIMEFLYSGEANVFQANLDSFLAIAEELKLKGLVGGKAAKEASSSFTDPTNQQTNHKMSEKSILNIGPIQTTFKPETNAEPPSVQMNVERRMAIPNFVSGDLKELDEKVKSMMEKSSKLIQSGVKRAYIYQCKVCGKEGAGIAIRDHIEANHLEGVSLPCTSCGKIFRSRCSLRKHNCLNR